MRSRPYWVNAGELLTSSRRSCNPSRHESDSISVSPVRCAASLRTSSAVARLSYSPIVPTVRYPPSTAIVVPVMYDAASVHKKSAAPVQS